MTTASQPQGKRNYKITSLIKGTATPDEIRALLLNWNPQENSLDYAKRVRNEGILAKQTAQRADDLILRVFRPWFLTPDDRAAVRLKELVKKNANQQIINELALLYKARAEAVLYDFLLNKFWHEFQEGALYLRTEDIEEFLRDAQETGLVEKGWSTGTQRRLAHGILGALKEAGFVIEERRYLYAYLHYRLSEYAVAYLAYDLHLTGSSDVAVVENPDWGLFGLQRNHVLERLSNLGSHGGMVVQQAGSVIRITWLYKTMDEVINAYFA
jgi:hypothetical protein